MDAASNYSGISRCASCDRKLAPVSIPGEQGWMAGVEFCGLSLGNANTIDAHRRPVLPKSTCPGSNASSVPLFDLRQLSGPAEEVWFAAFIAVISLLLAKHLRAKVIVIAFSGAVLRGIFHVYQGWESIGLFIWGTVAALAVAMTGRWLILFILHLLNNALIMSVGFNSDAAALVVVVSVCSVILLASENHKSKKPEGTE